MLTFDEAAEYLDEIIDSTPKELLRSLNGGISLVPQYQAGSHGNGLCVLGQYFFNRQMGRYILLYYGSFLSLYRHASDETWRKRLKEVLVHELTHHNESLAGVHDLQVKDEIQQHIFETTGIFTPTSDIQLFKKDN